MNQEESLVSIVIPVYNVHTYLEQCLESVCNQSYKNIEIIIINDGSTDDSSDICKRWEKEDERIKYFEQENKGLGPTRNRGIDLAEGQYITFIDSDDWVDKNYIQDLYWEMKNKNADICVGSMYQYDEKLNKFQQVLSEVNKNAFDVSPHIWGRMYKKYLFIRYNIKMPPIPYEDLAIYPVLEIMAKKTCYINTPLYYYRINTGKSIMDNINNIKYYPKALNYLKNEFCRLNLLNDYEILLIQLAVINMSGALRRCKRQWEPTQYAEVADSFRNFLDEHFYNWREIYDNQYWVWGSYNLSRIANHLMFEYDITDKNTKHYEFSSIISLMSNNKVGLDITHSNIFRSNMIARDIDKSFRAMDIAREDYIIVDFLEERYDIIKLDDSSYITKSEALAQSSYVSNDAIIIERSSEACNVLWKESCLKFIDFLKERFEEKKIILVEMYLCNTYMERDGKKQYLDDNIERVNSMLVEYYDFFAENFPGIKRIRIPDKFNYTDGDFAYGCYPYYLTGKACSEMACEMRKVIYGL